MRAAVKAGDLARVKELIEIDQSEINTPNSRGWTVLHEAAVDDKFFDIFQFLISAGAEFDYRTETGVSPFYVACKYGSVTIAKTLVKSGCKINDKFAYDYDYDKSVRFSFTPLHIACTRRNAEIISLLLDNNANMNVKDDIGRAPIHYAIDNVSIDGVRLLIKAGADLLIKDIYGCSPLHYASMLGNMEIFNLLKFLYVDDAILNHQTPEGLTSLMLACQFKHYFVSEELIKLGADTTIVDIAGLLAVHMAAHAGYRLFKLVLQNTPKDAIAKYASFRPGLETWRSLPCVIIESQYFESLELLFNSGLSEEILKCPDKINGHLVSPIGFLLLHNSRWFDKEDRLQCLEYFLAYDFMIDPVYEYEEEFIREELTSKTWRDSLDKMIEPASKMIGSVEAVVQMHSHLHEDCYCKLFLSMILAKIASPAKFLPCDSSRQLSLFNESAREGFIEALDLLRYSEYVDPDDVMEMLMKQMSSPTYNWVGHEDVVIKFLVERCITNFIPTFS